MKLRVVSFLLFSSYICSLQNIFLLCDFSPTSLQVYSISMDTTASLPDMFAEVTIPGRLCKPGAYFMLVLRFLTLSYTHLSLASRPQMMQKENLPHPDLCDKKRKLHSYRKRRPDSTVVQHIASGYAV